MSDLFEKSMRTLELPAVLEMLAQRAVSDEAKARCLRLRPVTDAAAVEHLLDETDAAILELFDRRQRLSAAIGAYKSAHGLPVRDKAREAEVLRTRGDMLPERRDQAERLMTLLMVLSREEQA